MPDLQSRLAEIRARLEKAHPGPWRWTGGPSVDPVVGQDVRWSLEHSGEYAEVSPLLIAVDCACQRGTARQCPLSPTEATRNLIAHAPADLRFLLRVVEGMQKIRDRVHAECCKGEAKIQREGSRDGMAVLCGITVTLASVRADIDRIAKEAGDE